MGDREIRRRFHRAVDTTLSGLEGDPSLAQRVLRRARRKEEPGRKRGKLSVGAAVALVMALMSVTALAAGLWGVIDFAKRRGTTPLEEAARRVQTGIAQQGGETSWAHFTLREAICDGVAAYLVFDVTPTDEHTLLVFQDTMPEESARYLSADCPEEMTIADYAEANGYTRIVRVSVGEDSSAECLGDLSIDEWVTESGITLNLLGRYDGSGDAEIRFICVAVTDEEERERDTLTATLRVTPPLWTVASAGAVDYPEAGIRINSLTLTGTVMSAYVDMKCTITNPAIFLNDEEDMMFEFLDENGAVIHRGALGEGSRDTRGGGGIIELRYTEDIQATEKAPSRIGVRAYRFVSGEACEPVTVELGE